MDQENFAHHIISSDDAYKVPRNWAIILLNGQFKIQDFLGNGNFGEVFKCQDRKTNKMVAIKILKTDRKYFMQGIKEDNILQRISLENNEHFVHFFGKFLHHGHICLVFELLTHNLYEHLEQRNFCGLPLRDIQLILKQILTALQKLKYLGLIHTDLKAENIMVVDPINQPLKIKLIDFGCACFSKDACPGVRLQSLYIRSPEIILGLPFSEAIDMWSLGCVAAELFLGSPLYSAHHEYDIIRCICWTLGGPTLEMLRKGIHSEKYFEELENDIAWKLKTPSEMGVDLATQEHNLDTLDDIARVNVPITEKHMVVSFVELLKEMLLVNPLYRITPSDAQFMPFLTEYLVENGI